MSSRNDYGELEHLDVINEVPISQTFTMFHVKGCTPPLLRSREVITCWEEFRDGLKSSEVELEVSHRWQYYTQELAGISKAT